MGVQGGRESRANDQCKFVSLENYLNDSDHSEKIWRHTAHLNAKQKFLKVKDELKYTPVVPLNFMCCNEKLYVSAAPMSSNEMKTIKDFFNIKAIINFNLCPYENTTRFFTIGTAENEVFVNGRDCFMQYFDKDDGIETKGISLYHIPMVDGFSPNSSQVTEFLNIMKSHENDAVLLHCYAGRGRSWTMATVYLNLIHKFGFDEIIKFYGKHTTISENQEAFLLNQNYPHNDQFDVSLLRDQINFIRDTYLEKRKDNGAFSEDIDVYSLKVDVEKNVFYDLKQTRKFSQKEIKYFGEEVPRVLLLTIFKTKNNLKREYDETVNNKHLESYSEIVKLVLKEEFEYEL